MATLPTPGADTGTWGDELNEFIRVSHLEDGNIRVADGQRLYFGAALDASFRRVGPGDVHFAGANLSVDGVFGALGIWGVRNSGTEIALAAYIEGQTDETFAVRANGKLEWGPGTGPLESGVSNLYRHPAGNVGLKTDGGVYADGGFFVNGPTPTSPAYGSWTGGGPTERFAVQVDGKMEWGDGTNPVDTNLWRPLAGYLQTDSTFNARQDVNVGGNLYLYEAWTDTQPSIILRNVGPNPPAIMFGVGGTTPVDTSIYRGGAGVAKTDGTFDAGALLIGGAAIGSIYQALTAKGAANGYASLDGSGLVPDTQIPAAIARDTEVTAAISAHAAAADPHTGYVLDADLTAHVAAADPHTGYQKESEKGVASGYASLDSGGKVPAAQLPASSVSSSSLMCYAYGIALAAGGSLTLLNMNGSRWQDWTPGFTAGQPKVFVPNVACRCRVTVTYWFQGQTGAGNPSAVNVEFLNAAGAVAETVIGGVDGLNVGQSLVHAFAFEASGAVQVKAASGAGGAGGSIYLFVTIERMT